MAETWHRRRAVEYAQEKGEVRRAFPQLHFFADANVIIRGGFPVTLSGKVIDRFQLEIILSTRYPEEVPTVREIGGRIPRIADRHTESNGDACLFIPEEAAVHFPPGSTLLAFLQGPVNSFFVSQLYFEEFGAWPFGEWGHGTKGTLEFYARRIGFSEPRIIFSFIDYLTREEVKGHWPCPCGSGKMLRKCHRDKVMELRAEISRIVASRSFERLVRSASQRGVVKDDLSVG
ncbi:MAG: SEC-C domain-containing protein [Acidobacteriota bacterium]